MKSLTALLCLFFCSPLFAKSPAGIGEDRIYKTSEDKTLHLAIIKPKSWKASDKRPAIVWFHGGGWVGGTPKQFSFQAQHFAELGFVCILPEYRLIGAIPGPPIFPCRDAKSAMRYVRSHAAELGIDPTRIAAAGGSAGGHLAAFTGLVDGTDDPSDDLDISPKPQAMLLFNPVLDNGSNGGWGAKRVGKQTKEFSPAHNVTKSAPPAIIFLGTKDSLIPVATMERFQKTMQKAGSRCELNLYAGASHGFFNKKPHRSDTVEKTEAFLKDLGWLPVAK